MYYSHEVSASCAPDNCPEGQQGVPVLYVVPNGKYTSQISQEDADAKADEDLETNCQDYANKNGDCEPVHPTGVTINGCSGGSLNPGQTRQLTAAVTPPDALNQTVVWSSSNSSIASVNASSGLVTAGSTPGTATITVTTGDGGKTATCQITVVAATTTTTMPATPDWTNTGNTKCASSASASDGSGCNSYAEQRDTAQGSPSYNQTRWVENGTCTSNPNWTDTGEWRCGSPYVEFEQRDMALCSSTYNQTRWTVKDVTLSCNPKWGDPFDEKCASSEEAANNTGNIRYRRYKDSNPYSSTFNQQRWFAEGYCFCWGWQNSYAGISMSGTGVSSDGSGTVTGAEYNLYTVNSQNGQTVHVTLNGLPERFRINSVHSNSSPYAFVQNNPNSDGSLNRNSFDLAVSYPSSPPSDSWYDLLEIRISDNNYGNQSDACCCAYVRIGIRLT
jgi:hypothetical protein